MKRDAVLAAPQKIVDPRGLYHGAALAFVRPGAS
jgi:hypothetical protein